MARKHRVVVVGGGFAGLACVRGLAAKSFDVTLIDPKPNFEFLPNIHELLSGLKTADTVQLPLKPLLTGLGHRFRRAAVTAIDPDKKQVVTSRGKPLSYDSLVMAVGAADATFGIPGVSEHSTSFKSAADCERIARRLARLAKRRTPARVVIIGGGLAGVEALGEILRRYRDADSGIELTLVEAQDRLLPQSPAVLDRHIRRVCAPHAVSVLCGTAVSELSAGTVTLADGQQLGSDLTIWTGGPTPPELLARSGLAGSSGWAPVDKFLCSTQQSAVYIAGDAAELPRPQARQAYHSLDMGACVARNLRRKVRGRQPARYWPSGKPVLVSFGDLSAMLIVGNCALAGPALGAGKELIFEVVMAQLDERAGPAPLQAVLGRGERAVRQLVWPTLNSLSSLRRQAEFQLLS